MSEAVMLENGVIKGIIERMVLGHLGWIIMIRLQTKPQCGYDILKHIKERYRILLSSGSIYSKLYALERKGYVEGFTLEGKRIYRITPKGQEMIRIVKTSAKFKNISKNFWN